LNRSGAGQIIEHSPQRRPFRRPYVVELRDGDAPSELLQETRGKFNGVGLSLCTTDTGVTQACLPSGQQALEMAIDQ